MQEELVQPLLQVHIIGKIAAEAVESGDVTEKGLVELQQGIH